MQTNTESMLDMSLLKPIYDEISALIPMAPVRLDASTAARVMESEDPALKSSLPWLWGCFRGPELMLRLNGVRVGLKLATCGKPQVLTNFRRYHRILTGLLQQDIQARVQKDADGVRASLQASPIHELQPVALEDRARLHHAANLVGVSLGELHSMIFQRTLH